MKEVMLSEEFYSKIIRPPANLFCVCCGDVMQHTEVIAIREDFIQVIKCHDCGGIFLFSPASDKQVKNLVSRQRHKRSLVF